MQSTTCEEKFTHFFNANGDRQPRSDFWNLDKNRQQKMPRVWSQVTLKPLLVSSKTKWGMNLSNPSVSPIRKSQIGAINVL